MNSDMRREHGSTHKMKKLHAMFTKKKDWKCVELVQALGIFSENVSTKTNN